MMGSKAFESPLISHARMRALYRALVEARVLGERAGKRRPWARGLEACWVATAIDLKEGDLTSVAAGAWLVEHVRAVGARLTASSATRGEIGKALRGLAEETVLRDGAEFDRMLCSVGMAMAVKGVVVGYVGAAALSAAEWKRLLTMATRGDWPLVLVVTPQRGIKRGANGMDVSDVVKRLGLRSVPVIPVDAGDVVAIYRVAQETMVRTRADGGVAVIECVDCGADPVATMAAQLVKKKICTERWVAGVEPGFRAMLAKR